MRATIDYISPNERVRGITNKRAEKQRIAKVIKEAKYMRKLGIESLDRAQALIDKADAILHEQSFMGRLTKKLSTLFKED